MFISFGKYADEIPKLNSFYSLYTSFMSQELLPCSCFHAVIKH